MVISHSWNPLNLIPLKYQSEIYEVAENSKKLSLDLAKAATLVKEQKQIFALSTDYLKSKLGWAMNTSPALFTLYHPSAVC